MPIPRKLLLLTALAATALACGSAPPDGAQDDSEAVGATRFFITAEAVGKVDLDAVKPPVKRAFAADPLPVDTYLKPMSCLGYYGPIGPWGPLGILGPVGNRSWNPDAYVSGDSAVGWHGWATKLADNGGPLSASGPLGSKGPLGKAYWDALPELGDFGKQLQGGGVWTVLGPLGPLGPLGALGPLGPVGAHGFKRDAHGAYVQGSTVQRTVTVPWEGSTKRTWELFENYEPEFAQKLEDNDTSFMVSARLDGREDKYPFTSREVQLVTVLVVPESASMFLPQAMGVLFSAAAIGYERPFTAPIPSLTTDDFDITLTDDKDHVVAHSKSEEYADWIQVTAGRGEKLTAHVTMKSSWDTFGMSPISRRYRLYVVGSTEALAKTSIKGPHQHGR